MVPQCRGIRAKGVHDGDVGATQCRSTDTGYAIQGRICTANQPRARDVAVPFA